MLALLRAAMDVDPGVAAAQALDLQLETFTPWQQPAQGKRILASTAGAAHVDPAILFGVGVESGSAFQPARFQTEGALVMPVFSSAVSSTSSGPCFDGLVGQHGQAARPCPMLLSAPGWYLRVVIHSPSM